MTRKLLLASALTIIAIPAYLGVSNATADHTPKASFQSASPLSGPNRSQSFVFDARDRDLLLTLLEPHRPFTAPDLKAEVSARFDRSWVAPSLEVLNL